MTVDIELWKFILMQGGLLFVAIIAVWYARAERQERISMTTKLIDMAPELVKGNMTLASSLGKLEDSVDKLADAVNRRQV